jgi:hypothetical protein
MKQLRKEVIYTFKWQLSFNHDYKITKCKKVINIRTENIIKETVVGYTIGYWIGKKFIAKKRLNDYCEKINHIQLRTLKQLYPNIFN